MEMLPTEIMPMGGRIEAFHPMNRKYIGSKTRLLPFITQCINEAVGPFSTLVDLFAGTGVVAYHFATRGKTTFANDHLYSNYVGLSTFLRYNPTLCNLERVRDCIDYLNALTPVPGYCAEHFSETYFTSQNAAHIDVVRERIQSWKKQGEISAYEFEVLLTSLLYAVDKVANTCGQYDAFLKHLGKATYSDDGTHQVDASAYKQLMLLAPSLQTVALQNEVFCRDANELAGALDGDVLYLDPPYNSRQYIDNYHVLENIATWIRPTLQGKTRKFPRKHLKSAYSSPKTVGAALDALLMATPIQHIFLSYNSEGLLDHDTLLTILRRHGRVEVFQRDYNVFGNGAGLSRKRCVTERLYYCRQ